MTRNSPDSRSADRSADGWPGTGCPSHPATGSRTVHPASANPPVTARHADPAAPRCTAVPSPPRQVDESRHGQQDQPRPKSPLTAPLPAVRHFPTATSRALIIPNGMAESPPARCPLVRWRRRRPWRLASAQQPAADRVGPGGDHDPRVWHRLVGRAQRPGHAPRADPGDQEHVGVARAGGEEDPEPGDVVHRAEQGLDLPLLAAVGPGVDVPDVDAAAQRRGARGQAGPGRRNRLVGLLRRSAAAG